MTPTSVPDTSLASPARPPAGTLRDLVAMARPDHWIKHVFIVPGIALAYLLKQPESSGRLLLTLLTGFIAAAAAASANYVLNEWLDAEYDAYHPTKRLRSAVTKRLRPAHVWTAYALLALLGLGLALGLSRLFLVMTAALLASGAVYNVEPLRTKQRAYLDVLSEAANNPIRLTLGWAMVDPRTLPPASLVLAYWMGGAFLMALKRFAEYRAVTATEGVEALWRYRRSFRRYTDNSLLVSSFLYAQLAAFFLAVFLIKYRVEYLLAVPLFGGLFAAYLRVGLKPGSRAQSPEGLFRERSLVAVLGALIVALVVLTFVDVPPLQRLTKPFYIQIGGH